MAHLALICADYPPGRDRLSSVGARGRMMKNSEKIFFRLFGRQRYKVEPAQKALDGSVRF
jgi:hypothetical protein